MLSHNGKLLFKIELNRFGWNCSAIAFDPVQRLAFCCAHTRPVVNVYTLDGTFVRSFKRDGGGDSCADSAACHSKQNFFISEAYDCRVRVFDCYGNVQRSIGAKLFSNGKLKHQRGICIANDELFVADSGNGCIQVFNTGGKFLRKFGEGVLKSPWNVCVDSAGNILVNDLKLKKDVGSASIVIFDSKGSAITTISCDDNLDLKDTHGAHGLCVDKDNRIYVLEGQGGCVQVFAFV